VPPPAAEPGSLREGFLGMLDSLDGRLQGLESRLAQLEANQLEQQQQWQAVRKELLEIRAGFEERLVRQRLKTVEAQAAEVEARMQLKNTREQLEQSAQQSSRLDARLGQRDIDNRELQQRTIALEEERDQLQRGLRATQSRLDSLRTQLRAIGGVTPGSE
jgi:chromosome segregation ATPase